MSSSLSERTKQRRRLLKAVAGVPAIVVLPAGAQTAATSLTCVDKGVANNPLPPTDPATGQYLTTTGPDPVWVRERLPDGTYAIAPDPVSGNPVAYASCWNSIVTTPQAGSDNVLIP